MAPTRCRTTPAAHEEASVGIMPHFRRKIATAAATVRIKAQRLRLDRTGASKVSGQTLTGMVTAKIVWIANQRARFRITPTTAAVIAAKAEFNAEMPRRCSMKGAPTKIQRKQGINVTQVANRPPRVPASNGDKTPGSR